ncbi:PSA5 protein, partial [Atractosteus spatula]|nr:PSA5 protein [Atractosteus spatula]
MRKPASPGGRAQAHLSEQDKGALLSSQRAALPSKSRPEWLLHHRTGCLQLTYGFQEKHASALKCGSGTRSERELISGKTRPSLTREPFCVRVEKSEEELIRGFQSETQRDLPCNGRMLCMSPLQHGRHMCAVQWHNSEIRHSGWTSLGHMALRTEVALRKPSGLCSSRGLGTQDTATERRQRAGRGQDPACPSTEREDVRGPKLISSVYEEAGPCAGGVSQRKQREEIKQSSEEEDKLRLQESDPQSGDAVAFPPHTGGVPAGLQGRGRGGGGLNKCCSPLGAVRRGERETRCGNANPVSPISPISLSARPLALGPGAHWSSSTCSARSRQACLALCVRTAGGPAHQPQMPASLASPPPAPEPAADGGGGSPVTCQPVSPAVQGEPHTPRLQRHAFRTHGGSPDPITSPLSGCRGETLFPCKLLGVNTFSPEGRLFQVEYAIEAIKLGSTAIGIQTAEGVCLAVEKRITSPLMEPSSIEKIVEIDSHIGCAMSGLIADAKTLIDKARVETQNHWFTYNETMTVESVTQAVSNLALQFGEEDADPGAMSRPFGVALLFGGVDEKGPQLYHMDPSGTFVQCDARAIGSASEGAQSSLQEVYHKSMTLKDAIKSSLTILKQVMEEKLNATNIELATVEPGKTFHMYTKEELEEVIKDI